MIKATPNHRWLLDDDTETIELKVQDRLRKPPNISSFDWRYLSLEEKRLWCKGFACGLDILGYSNVEAVQGHVQFMLNSNNVIYEDAFLESQYIVYHMSKDLNAGMIVIIDDMSELMIPNFDNPIDIKIFVHGFLSAASTRGGVYSGSPVEFTSIDLHGDNVDEIVDLISAAGYVYTTHGNDFNSNITTFFNKNQPVTISLRGNRTSTMLHFVNPANVEWRVLSIEEGEEEEVWCLEVESEHSFMLEDFIPTGNCCLINLEDILQNGTVINNIKIEKPHRLITAATIASQVIAAVSGAQYGGLTISLTHLAPFVRDSYNRYLQKYKDADVGLTEDEIIELAEKDTKKEIEDAIQTLNYQINSFCISRAQTPFSTVFMYLGETEEYKKELAMLIEETLKQRILGMKNREGQYITVAFPKLIYVLEEDNIHPDSPYYYLTELAAECTAKRMVPDYVSAKVLSELKVAPNGEHCVYGPMGLVKAA